MKMMRVIERNRIALSQHSLKFGHKFDVENEIEDLLRCSFEGVQMCIISYVGLRVVMCVQIVLFCLTRTRTSLVFLKMPIESAKRQQLMYLSTYLFAYFITSS